MGEETGQETMEAVTKPEITVAVEPMAEGTVAAEPKTVAKEAVATEPEMAEFMDDYTDELKALFKEFDEKRSRTYVEGESPDVEKWQELRQILDEKAIIKVKVKEIMKGGAIAYVDEIKAFISASRLSLSYVKNLEEFVGQYLEVYVTTMSPEAKRLILSIRDILEEHQETEKSKVLESRRAGDIVGGTVDNIKPHGAFINLDGGVSRLLHISQISTQRIKYLSVVLKKGQKIKTKVSSVADDKISLGMRVPEEVKAEVGEHIDFNYKGDGAISARLGDLLKGLKL